MRRPLYKSLLQSSLNAAGFPILAVPGDNIAEVYITCIARTDGAPGTGTKTNPWDGSTQVKADAAFKYYYDLARTNVHFHLDAGTFYLKGAWDYDWAMLSGWQIKGAGKTSTRIIQVVGAAGVNAGSNGQLFGPAAVLNQDNMTIEDLWCDLAWFRSGPGGDNSRPHGNFSGASTWGENGTIRNVKVTGAGWADNECFAFLTSGGGYDLHIPHNALIEGCEVSNGGNINLTAMAMINLAALGSDPSPIYARNGRILNNVFNIPNAGNAIGPPAGYDSGNVIGNTAIASYHGMFADTFPSKNIVISSNTFVATYSDGNGVLFNEGGSNTPYENITFIGNTVISAGGIGFGSAIKNSIISTNRILLYLGANPDFGIYLNDATTQNITVVGNIVDAGLPTTLQNGATAWFFRNRTPTGARIASMPDTDDAIPLTLYVDQASGNDTTALRLSRTRPFLTVNAAITAASSGDTVYVENGTFNERLSAKNGVTVRFRPTAYLVNPTTGGGCVISSGTSQTFTVYHEHAAMICSGTGTIGILANHSGAVLNIHADVSNTGASGGSTAISGIAGSTINVWGNVTSTNDVAVVSPGTYVVRGNITSGANIAFGALGKLTVFNGKITGAGTAGANMDGSSGDYVLIGCTIVATATAAPAINFATVGSKKPIFRDCVFVAGATATQSIAAGAAQSILIYGAGTANKGASPPTNITILGGTYAVDAAVVSDL